MQFDTLSKLKPFCYFHSSFTVAVITIVVDFLTSFCLTLYHIENVLGIGQVLRGQGNAGFEQNQLTKLRENNV